MNPLQLYIAAVALGNIAFWQCELLRGMFMPSGYLDWPDPDDVPLLFAFLLSPAPGLVAIADFLLAVRERTRREPLR